MMELEWSFGGFLKQSSHHEPAPFDPVIQSVVSRLEKAICPTHAIVQIERGFTIKRRRIYDVMNVFIAIGCAERSGVDSITWLGMAVTLPRLLMAKKTAMIDNYDLSLT